MLTSSKEKLLKNLIFYGSPDIEMDLLNKNHTANSSNRFIRMPLKTKI